MPDAALCPHGARPLIAQEVEGACLGDIEPSVGMDGHAGGVVRHGVQRAAVNHAEGIHALRPDVHPEHGPVLPDRFQLHVVVVHKGVAGQALPGPFQQIVHGGPLFSIIGFPIVYHGRSHFSTFFQKAVDKSGEA